MLPVLQPAQLGRELAACTILGAAVGVDQVGLHLADEGLKGLHVLAGIGAVGHAVHLVHGDVGLLQQGLEQTAPGDGHQSFELVPVSVAQVIQDHPARAADVGVADDIQHADHTKSLPSGRDVRRALAAPRASTAQNRNMTR